jgi:hypothetical protein
LRTCSNAQPCQKTLVPINPDTLVSYGYADISPEMRFPLSIHVHIDTGFDPPTKSGIIDRRNRRIHS